MKYRVLGVAAFAGLLSANALAVSVTLESPGDIAPVESAAVSEASSGYVMQPLQIPMEIELPKALIEGEDGTGYIESLGITRVPLPGAIWLFGSALIGMLAVGRRRPGKTFS